MPFNIFSHSVKLTLDRSSLNLSKTSLYEVVTSKLACCPLTITLDPLIQ